MQWKNRRNSAQVDNDKINKLNRWIYLFNILEFDAWSRRLNT